MEQVINSKVWRLQGAFSVGDPGLLSLDQGRVSFITEQGEIFNVPLGEVKNVNWPFLQFGFGFNAVVNGVKYKFTFMKPNGAADLDDSALSQLASFTRLGRGVDAVGTLFNWGDNKKSAKQWKAVLVG